MEIHNFVPPEREEAEREERRGKSGAGRAEREERSGKERSGKKLSEELQKKLI